ncbi:MAG: glycosyltransferase [Treponema sp.]|nr:glycosyltransferase [Treponema sp.]
MNIALFSDSYLPTKSGIVTVVIQLREQLMKLGHNVVLVVPRTTNDYDEYSPDIYQSHSLPLGLGTDQFVANPNMHHLISFLKEKKIDIIHCHSEFGVGKSGLRAARILGIPVICTIHTMWVDFYRYYIPFSKFIKPSVIDHIAISFYRKCSALIAVSSKGKNYYKRPNMIPYMPIVTIPNSIDQDKFMKTPTPAHELEALRQKNNIKPDDVVLLFVGRHGEEKRVFELLTLCKKLVSQRTNCKVMFVGNGPAYEAMVNDAKTEINQGKIIFTGFIPWQEVHKYYELADIFITASLSEMHSMTILEAQMNNLPIVTRKDESYADSVFDGVNGFLTDTDSQLLDKMLELVDSKEKREKFGVESGRIAGTFSIDTYMKRTLIMYEQVIKAFPGKIDEEQVQKMMNV